MLQTTNRKNDINALLINPILFFNTDRHHALQTCSFDPGSDRSQKKYAEIAGKKIRYQTTQVLQFLITGSRCLQRSVSTKQQASICKFDTCRDP